MSEERARRLGLRHARLTGAIERHNAYPDDLVQHRGGWAMDAISFMRRRVSVRRHRRDRGL